MKTTIKRMNNLRMHNPPDAGEILKKAGEILKKLCLEPLRLSVTKAAKALGVSRSTLSNLLHGRMVITPETAMRLAIASERCSNIAGRKAFHRVEHRCESQSTLPWLRPCRYS